jgi:radical SAM protein with 4Fe4S-binding SPASM domain
MEFDSFPIVIGWELTLACNLRCDHCGSSAGLPRNNELTLPEALDICKQFPEMLVHEVIFTGGEPLFRPDWRQIAIRLHELKIKTKLITNGLLLGPDTIMQLKDAAVARVGVSMDGLEKIHDQIRKYSGLFKHILTNIEKLLASSIPVTCITTVNALNIHQLPALFHLLQSLGVDIWQFQPIFPLGRARNLTELTLSENDYIQLGEFARDYMSGKGPPAVLPGDSFGYYSELDTRQPSWGGCSAGVNLCGITSDGRVKGCLSMPDELAEADLRQHKLWDIWFDANSFSYSRNFSLDDLGSNCLHCEYGEKCRGGCSSMSYSCTGRMHNNPYCFHRLLNLSGMTDSASKRI